MKVKYAAIFLGLSCFIWLLNDIYWIIQSFVEGWYSLVRLILSILMLSVPIALIVLSATLIFERGKNQ